MKATKNVQTVQIKNLKGEIKTIHWQLNPLSTETMFWFDDNNSMYYGANILKQILKQKI